MSIDISDISLANDLVFGEVMRQPENVKPLLEAVLEKEIAEIVFIEKQQDIKDGLYLHGIRLDISLADADGTQYCVEMQVGRAYDLEKRIRFYQSSIDRRTLEAAETYRQLHESYVIFICTEDYYKRGLALYKRKSVIEGAEDLVYNDNSHAYILNANFKIPNMSESALDFLRYIHARHRKLSVDISDSDYLTKIDQAVEDLKSDKGRVERLMTLAAKLQDERWIGRQEGLEEGIEKGIEKGTYDTKVATAKRLLERKMSLEDIADISGLTISEVKKLAEDE